MTYKIYFQKRANYKIFDEIKSFTIDDSKRKFDNLNNLTL